MKKQGIIFDLDGTLINTIYDLSDACNQVLVNHGFTPYPDDAYKHFVGNGMRVLMQRALKPYDEVDEAVIDVYLNEFKEVYSHCYRHRSIVYPGIHELLDQLADRGILAAVCTNKNQRFVKPMLDHYFPGYPFIEWIGERNDHHQKPDPYYPLQIAATMKLNPYAIAFVGDSDVDILTAKASGMFAVGVTWGFRGSEELRLAGADQLISDPLALLEI